MNTEQDKPNPETKVREMWLAVFCLSHEGEVAWNGTSIEGESPVIAHDMTNDCQRVACVGNRRIWEADTSNPKYNFRDR